MNGSDTILEIEGFDSCGEGVARHFEALRAFLGWMTGHVRKPVLRIASLHLKAGHAYAVIGKSGAGKTVLNSFLMGFPAFFCGRMVQLDNCAWWTEMGVRSRVRISRWHYRFTRVRRRKWREIRRKGVLLYLPQFLPDGRGYEMTTREYLRQIERALISDCRGNERPEGWLCDFPDDLKGCLHVPLNRLSGGERRRVELWVRLHVLGCIGDNPGLLILDEPTTGLDAPDEKKYMKDLSERLKTTANVAVLVTTHALHLLDGNDSIFDGVILVHKTPPTEESGGREVCEVSPATDIDAIASRVHGISGDKSGEAWSHFLEEQSSMSFIDVCSLFFDSIGRR